MKAYIYLLRKSLINWLIQLKRKPSKLIFFVIAIIYYIWLLKNAFSTYLANKDSLLIIFLFISFLSYLNSFTSFPKKEGVVSTLPYINYTYTAPLSYRKILFTEMLTAKIKGSFIYLIFIFFLRDKPLGIIFVLLYLVIDFILTFAFCQLTVANDNYHKSSILRYILILLLVLPILYLSKEITSLLLNNSFNFSKIFDILKTDLFVSIPIIGWGYAFIKLAISDFSTINIICASLYSLTTAIMLFFAFKVKNTGLYYEELIKRTQYVSEIVERSKKGDSFAAFRMKRNNNESTKARVKKDRDFKRYYAKTIFDKHLLEFSYKKMSMLFLSFRTLLMLLLGIVVCVVFNFLDAIYVSGIVFGIIIYITMLTANSGTTTTKELENHLLFIFPDTKFKKLFYSSLFENVKFAIDTFFCFLPIILFKGDTITVLFMFLFSQCYAMIHLYVSIAVRNIFNGEVSPIQTLIRFMIEYLVIGIVVLVFAGLYLVNQYLALVLTLILAFLGVALMFYFASKVLEYPK